MWSQGCLSASPHRIAALATCSPPESVKGMRSFIGAYKVLSRSLLSTCGPTSIILGRSTISRPRPVRWQSSSEIHRSTRCPSHAQVNRPPSCFWQALDCDWWLRHPTRSRSHPNLYVTRQDHLLLAGFLSSKLGKHQVTWLPCEVEALSIAVAVKHFSPFTIQSKHRACVLTDSQPCVQALQKLWWGEFSASPRVTSFLTTVSRYQISLQHMGVARIFQRGGHTDSYIGYSPNCHLNIVGCLLTKRLTKGGSRAPQDPPLATPLLQHLAGTASLPSDFVNPNAPDCTEPNCQICSFVHESESSVVRGISTQEVLDDTKRLPFTSRPAWFSVQNECPDLRRVCAHLTQGTRPSKNWPTPET